MQKLFLGGLLLIPILLVQGVAQPVTAEGILFATIARYASLNSFEATEVREWKTPFREDSILRKVNPGFCGSEESVTEEQCKILLGKQFKIKLNQTAYLEEQKITIQLTNIYAPNCLKGSSCHGDYYENTIKIIVKNLGKEASKEFTLHEDEKEAVFGFEIECRGIGGDLVGLVIREPITREFEMHEMETQISYEAPLKFKFAREGEITIVKDGWNYAYNKEDGTACKTTSDTGYLNAVYLPLLIKTFFEYYEAKYAGIEEINGKEHYIIQLIPEKELDWEGDKLLEQKIWITKDYIITKIEIYENKEWTHRVTFKNIKININIPDSEFEMPEGTDIFPKTFTFSDLDEANAIARHEIKVPAYLPPQVELSSIEIQKSSAQNSTLVLIYTKNNEKILTIVQLEWLASTAEEPPENDITGFDGPYKIDKQGVTLQSPAMVHGYRANFAIGRGILIDWQCEATGTGYIVESHSAEQLGLEELEKILDSFRCY